HRIGKRAVQSRPPDRLRKLTLPLCRDRGDTAWHDLAALGNETLQELDILVIDLWRVWAGKRARFSSPEEGTACRGTTRRSARRRRLTFHLRLHSFGHRTFDAFTTRRPLRCPFAAVAEPLPFPRTAPLTVIPAATALHDCGRSLVKRIDPYRQIADHIFVGPHRAL